MRTDIEAKLFQSSSLTYNFNWIKELKIRSLNMTLDEFTNFLDKHNCLFIPYGESVKDIFLGSIKETSPLKIEGESTCDTFKVIVVPKLILFIYKFRSMKSARRNSEDTGVEYVLPKIITE